MKTKKILVGSPVRQKHQILKQFLLGLVEVDKSGFDITYYFVDDNIDEKSTKLLNDFSKEHEVIIKRGDELTSLSYFSDYISDEVTHIWDASSIRKVAYFKDSIIDYALKKKYDYLFLIDSDIVVDRRTLQQLASRNVEIISNVFWTQWQPNWQLEPQCFWMPALNRQSRAPFAPPIDSEEARQIQRDFFAKMRIPGIYKVDGLGACTLIARNALEKGVRFKEIPNLSLLGEDRHFCVRAGALGIDLYFDTVYPVYHIYREEYLDRVEEFKREGFKYDMCQTFIAECPDVSLKESEGKRIIKKIFSYLRHKLVSKIYTQINPPLVYNQKENNSIALLMMVLSDDLKYFKESLSKICDKVDYILIADTIQLENVEEICENTIKHCPYKKILVEVGEEHQIYQKLWDELDEYNPGWILALNANELMAEEAGEAIKYLVENRNVDSYRFKCNTRSNAQTSYMPYLMRYQKSYKYDWKKESYSEKFPNEIGQVVYANVEIDVIKM